jgi:plastocyanin
MLALINSKPRLKILFGFMLSFSILVAACQPENTTPQNGAVPGTGEEFTVSMAGTNYSPDEITIPVGSTVVWTNTGTMAHTVTGDDDSFASGILEPGETFSYTFNEPGEFQYYCEFHGDPGRLGMAGVVIVTDN